MPVAVRKGVLGVRVAGGRMKSSSCDRVVDAMEQLYKFALLVRGHPEYRADQYGDRKENALALESTQTEPIAIADEHAADTNDSDDSAVE
jgi:hypothetical protein